MKANHNAHENDLRKLIHKKAHDFKSLFPYYKDYEIYLGVANFSLYPMLEEMTKQNDVAILKRKGDVVEIEATNLMVY